MKSPELAFSSFLFISFINIIFCSCNGPKLLPHPVDVKVFSMKLPATEFIHIRDSVFKDTGLILFTFHKETIGSRYLPEGKLFPATSTKKIRLKKNGSSRMKIYFRSLVLSRDSIDTFILRLDSLDHIDLRKYASNYEIIFKATQETDPVDDYVEYTIYASEKRNNTKALSTASTRANPCPPCRYSSTQ
jgi:hypothetical protein